MAQVRWRVLRGVAGAAGLIAVVVGIPRGLMALGQPLPSTLPGWHEILDALGRPVTDSTLLRAAGLACWLVWAAFVVAVAIEVVGQVVAAGRMPTRTGVPGLQRVARTLVLTAALLLPQRGATGAVAATAASPAWASRPVAGAPVRPEIPEKDPGEPVEPAHHPAVTLRPPTVASPSTSGAVRYVVRHYDSPWAIAERHLGDGTRWRELRDTEGRSLERSPRPGRGRAGGARIIYTGEVLHLPAPGRPGGAGAPAPPPTADSTLQAGSGAVPGPDGPAATSATARSTGAGPSAATGPSNTTRTATSAEPMSGAGAPEVHRDPSAGSLDAPVMQALPDGPLSGPRPPVMLDVTSQRQPAGTNSVAGTLLEAGMVGAAVLALLKVLRQRQAQRRPSGRRIRLPGPRLARSELAIRTGETGDRAALAGSAIDLLADTLQGAAGALPTILGVVVDDDAVEVLLDRPAPPIGPWTATAEGFRWRIPADEVDLDPAPRSAPLPALTPLGRTATGDADALINLEAAGLVAIAGQPARAAGVLHAIATHLCGAPWAGAVDVVLIGLAPGLASLDRARTAPSLAAIRDELCATAGVMSATMADHGCADAFQGRVRGLAGDGWPPTVVLSAAPMTAVEWGWLSELARPGTGVAAVAAGAGTGTGHWVIDADACPLPVDPLRLAIKPVTLDAAAMADIVQLLEIAGDHSGATLADPPYDHVDVSVELQHTRQTAVGDPTVAEMLPEPPSDHIDVSVERPRRANTTMGVLSLAQGLERIRGASMNGNHREDLPALPEPEILVRVLGSVDVEGAAEFKRAKGRELVVYLAMHPHGVGEAELDEALWPSRDGRLVSAPTRDSTVSAARRAVGGPSRLLPALGQGREKRYQVGPGVQSDWGLFCVLHRWGRDRSSAAALRAALESVRGRPFEGVVSGRTYGWIHTEGHGRHIEAEVSDAADLAAGLYLRAGDAVGARWAARRGLMADPFTERLWVRLMEAADLLGESQEIERVMDELDAVLELEGDFSGLHPNTLTAYDRLSRRHRFLSGR